jgi:small conductance mechanosensitive channel
VALADLLDQRGLPTATYRQLAIEATGQITSDVLDPTVAVGLLRGGYERAMAWLRRVGPNALVMIIVLAGAILVSRTGFRLGWRFFKPKRERKSRLVTDLLERSLLPVATVVGFLVGLTLVGVDTTALLAGLGVLGVIVGLALQDTLGNLAAGLFILVYRPFDVDDIVTVAGVTGVVRAMGLASTTIVTADHRRLFVPNSKVWGEVIQNASAEGTRRVDLDVPITYEEDPSRAIALVRAVCADYDLVLDEPETLVFVKGFRDSAVDLHVNAWATAADWWTVTTQLPLLIRERFLEAGIGAPYPRWVEQQAPSPEAGASPPADDAISPRPERAPSYELR